MFSHDLIIVLDFGGQYNQLIARRVREANIYCEVLLFDTPLADLVKRQPKGIIFTGGPSVVYEENAPKVDKALFEAGIPILGICYGAQLMAHVLGGSVEKANQREYGNRTLHIAAASHAIFTNVPTASTCWMSHTYQVEQLPAGFHTLASTESCTNAAFGNDNQHLYGVQYHPEVVHTTGGIELLHNFLYKICGCAGDWKMSNLMEENIEALRQQIGTRRVICALSGGVDSSVAAALVHRAVGKQLVCIFVDNGLLRKDEADSVEAVFTKQFDVQLVRVNAQKRFLDALAGVSDPERKRKIIGELFIRIFEEESLKLDDAELLVQGTIYPDVIESGTKHAAVIKTHHNVGGLPDNMRFKELVEPLRLLFKDEVRALGRALGLPNFIVDRQPFPGPGLAIRVMGEVSEDKLAILREADAIYREEVAQAGLNKQIWQYFAVLTGIRTVGVMGDERTYSYTLALRGVTSTDGMTADWARIPFDVLERISSRITNEVPHINRVVYDITSKPPATIEWE